MPQGGSLSPALDLALSLAAHACCGNAVGVCAGQRAAEAQMMCPAGRGGLQMERLPNRAPAIVSYAI